jgi:phosphoribosylpyrophosphate synthetase
MAYLEPGTRDQRWDEILEIGRQNRGNYRQWVAQAGTLVADLLTVAGTDHVITMDLHVLNIPIELIIGSTISGILQYSSGQSFWKTAVNEIHYVTDTGLQERCSRISRCRRCQTSH